MKCTYCKKELVKHDYYGKYDELGNYTEVGDLLHCENSSCEMYDEMFYTDEKGELHEGDNY